MHLDGWVELVLSAQFWDTGFPRNVAEMLLINLMWYFRNCHFSFWIDSKTFKSTFV